MWQMMNIKCLLSSDQIKGTKLSLTYQPIKYINMQNLQYLPGTISSKEYHQNTSNIQKYYNSVLFTMI